MEIKTFLKKSLKLAIASKTIFLVSVAVSLFSLLLTPSSILGILLFAYGLGWMGTKVALIQDVYLNGRPNWRKTGIYFKKYFVRFLPLLILTFTLGPLLIILITVLNFLISKTTQPDITIQQSIQSGIKSLANLYTLDLAHPLNLVLFLLSTLLAPFFVLFTPLVVIKDISFFKGIVEVVRYIRKNSLLYKILFLESLIFSVMSYLTIFQTFSSILNMSMQIKILSIFLNQIVDIFTISLVIIYAHDIEKK